MMAKGLGDGGWVCLDLAMWFCWWANSPTDDPVANSGSFTLTSRVGRNERLQWRGV